jgi:hypothetical protein
MLPQRGTRRGGGEIVIMFSVFGHDKEGLRDGDGKSLRWKRRGEMRADIDDRKRILKLKPGRKENFTVQP